MSCPGWREVAVKVVGPPASNGIGQRRARVTAARPAIRIGGPTVIHGMRWVGLDAARVSAVVVLDVDGLGKGVG